ncbi:hypothetical protein QYE76_045558 [Lolium multiflorum]|uniref:ATP-dependent DNA helicase n=1 Tax=Lolium multiflorum TaxID=4521 RepID=A0AAD8TKL4_LOLMU|nr:hypothetical protein QYE76_045558 [Lolium multiflorum]
MLKERDAANDTDEIKKYLEMRYISTTEACWRLFQFDLHHREPPVERLPFHLENEQQVIFPDSTDLEKIVTREGSKITKFTQWMEANKIHELGKELTYAEFPSKFVWKSKTKSWEKRKTKDYAIGRIYYAHPASGDRYYLRMLLNTMKGCTSFENIRTVDGVIHPTYKLACKALGFLDDDNEWIECINEASSWASGTQLRQLFTTILTHCEVTSPKMLWDSTWEALCEDMQYKRRTILNFQTLQLTTTQKKAYALIEIEKLMRQVGKSLKDYPDIDLPNDAELEELGNRLINEELNYDMDKLKDEHQAILNNLNQDQKKAYDAIMESVDKRLGKQIFVEGYGGTGKTYLWKAITTKLRSEGKIVLAVASCGIAALLLQGIPDHQLKLKVGLPVMLLRNINQAAGLCNGTRMTITQLGNKFIEAQIITGTHVGEKVEKKQYRRGCSKGASGRAGRGGESRGPDEHGRLQVLASPAGHLAEPRVGLSATRSCAKSERSAGGAELRRSGT